MKSIALAVTMCILFLVACSPITTFAECEAAGYDIMESYPRKCAAQGKVFVEGEEAAPIEEPVEKQAEQINCLDAERNREACTLNYDPVCGWFDDTVNCVDYPCAQTFANRCGACTNPTIAYTTEGECPQ